VVLGGTGVWWLMSRGDVVSRYPIPGEEHQVEVEVLNGTTVNGLARTMTLRLRRAGIDVVFFGDASHNTHDSTSILIRRGDSSFVDLLRDAIGGGRVVMQPDDRLLVDATIVLGLDVAPGGNLDP
jgi:hypothetical protein